MDGAFKSVQKTYVEEGGMILEDLQVDSLPEYMEKQLLEGVLEEEEDEVTLQDELQSLDSDQEPGECQDEDEEEDEEKVRSRLTADSMPFDKFLDFMEIF